MSPQKVPPVLEAALPMSDASEAAMYQNFYGSSLLFVLDEAEVSKKHDTKHDQRTKDLIRYLYSMPMGGVNIFRGGATRDAKVSYKIRMPVLMAAINIPADPTFLSRTLVISTIKQENHKDLVAYIEEYFSNEQLEDLRRGITTGLLAHIPEIMERRRSLRDRLPEVGRRHAKVTNRFMNTVLTPLAVYEMLGFDAEDLYAKIVTCYRDRLEAINAADSLSDLVDTCLYRKVIKVATQDTFTDDVSAQMLIFKGEYNILNSSGCGVYYLAEKDWIVIVWRQAKFSVLEYTQYFYQEESALREHASKNPYVIPEISPEDQKHIAYQLRLVDVKNASNYTVLEAGYLIKHEVDPLPPKPVDDDDDPSESTDRAIEEAMDFTC